MLQNLIFSGENLFTVEAAFIHQHDRVLSKSLLDIPLCLSVKLRVKIIKKPASVMVLTAVCSEGKSPLIFFPEGVKINHDVNINKILEGGPMPRVSEMHPNANLTFQQDGVNSHTANLALKFCRNNCPQFID